MAIQRVKERYVDRKSLAKQRHDSHDEEQSRPPKESSSGIFTESQRRFLPNAFFARRNCQVRRSSAPYPRYRRLIYSDKYGSLVCRVARLWAGRGGFARSIRDDLLRRTASIIPADVLERSKQKRRRHESTVSVL